MITTEDEYQQALAEIRALWDYESDTPDAERFGWLVDQVDAYEADRWPIDLPSLEEARLFRAEQEGAVTP